ncbi:hypothetical protein IEQ34_016256 [Dendrobium chrysotoxum]|uniref:inositol-phosphate phosphatase n=1 Tax=Dendrobium chrysotoxum TaxID=161865 RepID=A0AAV7GDT8_DENCH|nr:hypothetical protein IEQ34_016256 [Dendrobium chrysotoxum]
MGGEVLRELRESCVGLSGISIVWRSFANCSLLTTAGDESRQNTRSRTANGAVRRSWGAEVNSGRKEHVETTEALAFNKMVDSAHKSSLVLISAKVGTTRDKSTVDATTNRINSLLFKVRSLRMDGSCALNLCGVACGRLDIFYELGFGGPWDVAGGAIILQEAGGLIFDPYGGDFDIMSRRVAASNGHLKDLFLVALKEAEGNHPS